MKLVPLTHGKFSVIDDDDFALVSLFSWRAKCERRCARPVWYAYAVEIDSFGMHRLITNPRADLFVDHKDGDGLNNTRANLRVCTAAQNMWNRGPDARNPIGLKGVTFHRLTGRWQARIGCNGVSKYLGLFDTPELAHAAYAEAAKQLHGEFAKTSWSAP